MDAFEHVIAELFWAQGYWVRTSVAVEITKADKVEIGTHSMPRPEIDLVAYDARHNAILAIECKSYLNSRGVTFGEICGAKDSKTYKMFRRPIFRRIVLQRLAEQLLRDGFCQEGVAVTLGLVAGRVSANDQPLIAGLFEENGWFFRGPDWVRDELTKRSKIGYENQVSTVVTKLLLKTS